MSRKRNVDELLEDLREDNSNKHVKFDDDDDIKKHTLDSDEEDEDKDRYNVLNENDIEGEEDSSTTRQDGETRMTAFNMQEEMEMGHFDRDGHFIWKNEKEVRDNWLDNIDWQRVNPDLKNKKRAATTEGASLGDSDDDEEEDTDAGNNVFNEIETYRLIVTYLKPGETINKALRRLGGDLAKLSSVERLKRKKAGTLHTAIEVTELTELANEILTRKGNMDIYQETYEVIQQKLTNHDKKSKSKANIVEAELDMYSDDFDKVEGRHLSVGTTEEQCDDDGDDAAGASGGGSSSSSKAKDHDNVVKWQFKWDRDGDKIEGPFETGQMNKWQQDGYFKSGVWVRKCGSTDENFYSSQRIDFELYL